MLAILSAVPSQWADAAQVAPTTTLEVAIHPQVNGSPLLLDSLRYHAGGGEPCSITRCSYLLSGFALEKVDGGWVTLDGAVGYFDAATSRTSLRIDGAATGQYRALRFDVGLDEQTNHADPSHYPPDHALNPMLNGLHWDWQSGYIFLALEGRFRDASGSLGGYVYHLANAPNRTRITIPLTLDLTRPRRIDLRFDLGVVLCGPCPLIPSSGAVSTHSRPDDPVAAAMKCNLAAAFQLLHVESDVVSAGDGGHAAKKPLYLPEHPTPYRFTFGANFPIPALPADNPLLQERVTLGARLFEDGKLSSDGELSCASCHQPAHAFSDSRQFSMGVEGRTGDRNAMPLFNLAWKRDYRWDGKAATVREQVLLPIQNKNEMNSDLDAVIARLKADPSYPGMFRAAFGDAGITPETLSLALENYTLAQTSYDSHFDRAMRGEEKLTDAERRGFELFSMEYEPRLGRYGGDCFHCHGGALFSDFQFHNNGLGETKDLGRYEVTGKDSDRGKFVTPSLRNVALTAPYMHDGRFKTLEEVVAHYNGPLARDATLDPNLAKHPREGLGLSTNDQAALVAFLKSLTDPRYASVH